MMNTQPKALFAAPIDLKERAEVGRIRKPQVAKRPLSRSAKKARKQDGVDTSVRVSQVTWTEIALSDCEYGCKVYRSSRGRTEVQHHGVYGCPRDGERELITR